MSQKSVINRGIANIYSLTSLQEGMLYHKLANAESTSYVIQNRFEASGEISEDIIKQSLQLLFLKHEVLRTSIVYEKLATPRQVILKNREAEFERIDLSGWSEREQIEQLEAIERLDVERGFDLQQDSLLRIKLVVLGPTCYKMIWTYHHIIMDGWCLPILYGDFKRYYDLLQSGRSMADMERMVAVEKKQTAEYGEYVKWLEQQDLELGLSYWGELLADYDETAEIKPLSKPEPVVEQMAHTRIKLSREQTESLLDLAASSRVTINTVTEAAWGIVLQAYSGTRDVVFGKTVSGRQADVRGIEQIVGLFIATIPTRVRCEEETTVSELLKELQVQGTKGNEYCYCPFPQILGLTKQKADLVKTLYVFENYEFDQAVLTGEEYGLQLKPESAREQTNYGINLIASLEDEVLNLKIMYNPNEFVQGDIESILSRMETVLLSFAANPDGNVSSIETVTAQERVRILEEFNDTALEYPRDRTVVDLFEEQVRTAPDRIAVVDQGEQLTYAELNRKVNQVAWKLREMGVKPDERVAIIAERSIEMVAGIYGIIKAGGAYVPIDPTFPEDRLRFMLEDCGARAVLLYQAEPETELPILDLADGAIWDGLSDNPDKVNKPDDLAYVIYTSGTTGQPKGVMLQHRGVVAMRAYLKELYQVTAQDNVLQFANYVFDAAVWEMTLSLLMGARLTLIPKEIITDVGRFNDFVNQSGITLTLLPPQYYLQTEFTGLKVLTTGGSASNAEVIHKAAASQSRYVNAYGPTENTVLATHWEQDGTSEIPHPVPIGRPIANSQIFILNGMNLCGIGIPGELCIAGDGVARGYLNKPELTAERFIPNPFGEGKLYRSGDLAKWLPDGNIEYLGRIDEQVKIRGFRIELGEIENALRKIDSLQDAAVITRADASGDQALYAYLVADETLRLSDIRDALNRSLPDYMIPAHMMQIDSLPVTRSGKLDRKALPEIEASGERGYVAPRNDIEETLCQVFGQILGAEIVGAKDNFFELGGDSIKAIRIVSKMRSAGYSLSVKEIMSRHTVEAIAHAVVDASGNHYEQNEVTGTVLPTPILEEFASWQLAKPHHFNQDMMLQVELDDEIQLQKVLTALAVHHDIIRSVYRNGRLEILSSRESDLYDFKAFDLRQEESVSSHIEAACTDLQSSIDLERGPLMKAALFCTAEGNFLFLCLHHLVVDGVSWRILLEDLNTALGQVKEGQKISFPAKTASFKEWAEALAEYKTGRPMQKERAYWEQVVSEMEAGRIAVETGTDETGPASIAISLSAEETEQLVQRAGKAYNTEMNDLLIGAIGLSVKRLTGQDVVSIGLEGHGREEIHKPIDIDRTIGWFTTKYPIVVACCAEVNEAIVQTKEMLRKVPNHGLGYGLLQQELQAPSVDLLFNYLGQMDAESKTGKASFFSAGKSSADENITPGKISFNGYISEGVLSLVLAYDKGSVSGLAMEEFAALYKQSLLEIIEHCLAQKETRKTPSDYSTNDLTGEDLTVLQNAFEKPSRIEDIYSLTPLQQGMLFHNLADKQSTGYVVQNVLSVRGEVEEEKIKQALKLLTLRHDALRTAIVHDDLSQPRQVLLHDREVGYDKTDLQGLDEQEQQTAIADLAKRHVKHGFDLQNDPLLRVHYIVQSDDRHKLIWNYHHIIMDGWCLSILYGDFNRFYRLLRNGTSLSELERMVAEEKRQTASYGEYIQWMERQDHEAGLSYWEDLLADYEETADIKPVQKPEPTDEQVRREVVKLSADTSKKLHQIAAAHQLTVNNLVEASWGLVLQAYSGTRDVVFGKVVSGRQADVRGIEGILGLFINTMPTRVRSRDGMTVSELWKDLQKQGTESDPHSYCSLAEIQSSSQQKNDLIRVAYAFDNYFVDGEKLKVEDGALAFEVESSREQTNYDITLCAYQKGENLIFDLMYNPNVYAQEEIQRVLARVEVVLQAMAANPDEKLAAIDTITEPERVRILDVFNDTATDYPRDRSVVELLEEQVRTFPQKTALVVGEERLTYAELNRKANRLAAKLRELGVKPDDFVAILTERKVETIIGICGILKAGGAYVPIDPTYPEDRIRFILEDCRPKAVLHVQAELETDLPAFDLTDGKLWEGPSDDPEPVNKPGDLAYCIYTSGTTGKPKGTLIEHKSVIRLVKDTNYVELDDTRVILQTGSMSFDASTFEVWGALLHGGTLVLADQEVITDDKTLKEYLLRYEVTTMWLTASLYNLMIQSDAGMFDSLTELLIGGEKLSEEHVRLLKSRKKNVKLINGYGPTENTTFTATYEIPEQFDLIPIGNPIANTQVYILNGDKLCGIGIPGELCIAGDGLARGYLNRPDLTAEKFTANPFGEGKLYRSGDLARWRPDGLIEYLGRIDEQVKIRGFRIELGEIENALRKVETIRDAAVIARVEESGDKAICAYLVSDEEISFPALRDALSRSLPDYMIPAHMMQIESIPVTRNGKLDRRALPEIEASSDREYVAPRNDIEAALCQVFSQILGAETVGVKDSFFELGGDSIKAIRIVSKMRSAGYSLSVKEIMSKHTVEAIAHAVVDAGGNRYEQGEVTGTVLPTPILEEFASWPLAKPHHFNQDMMLQIELDDEIQLQQVLTALAVHHDIIRSVYRNGRLEILSSRESDLYDFKAFDLRQEKEVSACIEAACTDLQGSIDLEQGPLMKAALFCTAAGNFLFLCLHHLVVDGVSWRILLEDLNTALGQVKEGQPIRFPAKTASFKEWAESLAAYKTSRPLQKERTYWEQVVSGMEAGRIAVEESTDETGPASIAITLSAEDTERLVHRAGKAYHTEMNDLLISAIGRSVKRLTGQATVTVGLEGHGREEIHKPIDIDRTIGWFTTKYPIVVACCDDVKEAIVQTKEMLRKVPNHGLGYGLLQQELQAPSVDLTFNYLGQMDAESQAGKASFFSAGKSTADENTASGKISFNGYISDGVLHLVLAYDKGSVSGRTMETFAALYQESLVEIIEHCLAQKETVKTPSDYSASDLSGKDLSLLQDRFKNLSRVEDIYSLTPLQQGMLFHNLADKQSTGYVIQNVLSIQEEVEEEKIKQALQLLTRRHDVLRTAIVHDRLSKPRQVLLHDREVEYDRTDLSGLDEREQQTTIADLAARHVKRGFDLQEDPLLRVHHIVQGDNRHKLIWNYHHIIMDGWCLSILYGDFNRFYRLLRNGASLSDVERMIAEEKRQSASYGEYIQWVERQDRDLGLSYWEELLADYEETADIKPVSKPEPTDEQVRREVVKLSADISKTLLQTAAAHQLTVNNLVEAAWGIVLQAYSGTQDVVFGKVVSGRQADVKGIESILGMFINTIPTRVRSEADMTVLELWKNQQLQGTESDQYSYCSLADIQSLSQQKNELIKVIYAFENYFVDEEKLKVEEGALSFVVESAREQTNYDMTLSAYLQGDILVFDLLYNPNVYAQEEIQSILARMEVVLRTTAANPHGKLAAIEAITEQERVRILGEFNDTVLDYAKDRTVVDMFEEQVSNHPDRIAVVFQEEQLTFAELNRKVNQVAWKLREMGVKPDDRVAIMAERSLEMIVGIYGIIKAGGAYVPIDPTFPADRIRFMLEDCGARAVLVYQAEPETELPALDLADGSVWQGPSDNPEKVNKPDDLAYVIYTSGTTGQPKGVMLRHQGVVAMRAYLKELYQVTAQDNVLQFANYVFDAAVWEMTLSLLNGARLTLVSKEIIADIGKFDAFVEQSGITLTLLPPQFYLQTGFTGLKVLTTGGSASNAEIIRKAAAGKSRYVNAYGPTENTVLATHWEYDGTSEIPQPVPIGRPISNTQIYILNGMNLCGIGIPGELCIAGDGVARGYLNKPELTAEKFIANPFGEGRLYRSGDLARWLPDGNIEYLGRIDEQEKIRGFRIELGEIESALRKLEHIVDAAVIARNDPRGDKALHAYVVSDIELGTAEIKEALKGMLPDYMIPAFIMRIDSIPVTRSGKLDKQALPMPDLELFRQTEFVAAQNEYEHELTVIWKNILHFDEIGIHDNFFDLGGNSLLITVMLSQIEEKYPGLVKVGDLFANPTIAQIASHIEAKSLGTIRCMQIPFPDSYFKQSNKGLQQPVIRITDEGSLYQRIKALHAADESELYARLLFGYSYLLFDATGQQELAVCTVNQKDFVSFELQGEDDLNVLMEAVRQNYLDALKFQRGQIRIDSKEKGLMPIFLYQFSGSDFYQDYIDFSLSFHLAEGSVTFAAEIFNKRISESKVEELLGRYVQVVQYLFESMK